MDPGSFRRLDEVAEESIPVIFSGVDAGITLDELGFGSEGPDFPKFSGSITNEDGLTLVTVELLMGFVDVSKSTGRLVGFNAVVKLLTFREAVSGKDVSVFFPIFSLLRFSELNEA